MSIFKALFVPIKFLLLNQLVGVFFTR